MDADKTTPATNEPRPRCYCTDLIKCGMPTHDHPPTDKREDERCAAGIRHADHATLGGALLRCGMNRCNVASTTDPARKCGCNAGNCQHGPPAPDPVRPSTGERTLYSFAYQAACEIAGKYALPEDEEQAAHDGAQIICGHVRAWQSQSASSRPSTAEQYDGSAYKRALDEAFTRSGNAYNAFCADMAPQLTEEEDRELFFSTGWHAALRHRDGGT
jgi:hypothetical protein